VASLVVAALAGAALAPFLKGAIGSPDALELAAYGAITFAALAALLGAVAHRARRVIGRVLLGLSLGAQPQPPVAGMSYGRGPAATRSP
jgi:MFS-type transporter involved in bile tolerance (Atg22 family)